jgi:hypothetical protein
MPSPWHAELPALNDWGRRAVLTGLLDILVYRDVTRDDVRELYEAAAKVKRLVAMGGWGDA